jgi:GT2 family glycosyltransferase
VIPFRDGADLLRRCVDGLHRTAGYARWEALLVDNKSWEPETEALLRRLDEDSKCRRLEFSGAFNWAAVNNWAVEQAEGDLLLFLNNDVEGVSNGWLEAMVEHGLRPEVGAVGARLLYPDGRIQHAGVLVGQGSVADHAFRFCPADAPGYFYMASVIRNCTAVTGACMMVRKATFAELGGFDEDLAVAYNDIDFCLRMRDRGYLIVYTPFAELTHHESVSRGRSTDTAEARIMVERWSSYIKEGDPYSNPNLSRQRTEFALPQENEVTPWEILTLTLKT